jgi:hypothetical protein
VLLRAERCIAILFQLFETGWSNRIQRPTIALLEVRHLLATVAAKPVQFCALNILQERIGTTRASFHGNTKASSIG